MPAAILEAPTSSGFPPRKKFTRELVEQMLDAGMFDGQRFELIDGDLIDKMGQNPPHASAIQLLMDWAVLVFGKGKVRVQLSIEVAEVDRQRGWPEPDIAVLAEAKADYRTRHPEGHELLLLVEVADTTLRFDATTKRDLYARAGVPEYWVLDLNGRQLIGHRQLVEGRYQQIVAVSEQETATLEGRADTQIRVSELLP